MMGQAKKNGHQAIGNRMKQTFEDIDTPFTLKELKESDGTIRTSSKRAFGFRFKNINPVDNVADTDICEVTAAALILRWFFTRTSNNRLVFSICLM
jgi:hypothetical protein